MDNKELQTLYTLLGDKKIDTLYYYSCLLTSGFTPRKAVKLTDLLEDLWLKDENDISISRLSDMLFDIYDDIKDNIKNLSTREILCEMYRNMI